MTRPAATAGEIRVFIHYVAGRDGDADLAQRLARHLERRGLTVADIRPVDFSIGKPSVRYFFEADRSAGERLVDELGSFLNEAAARSPDHASDFTHFTPKPRPGNVEVWLAGPRDNGPDRLAGVRSVSEIGAAAPMPEH